MTLEQAESALNAGRLQMQRPWGDWVTVRRRGASTKTRCGHVVAINLGDYAGLDWLGRQAYALLGQAVIFIVCVGVVWGALAGVARASGSGIPVVVNHESAVAIPLRFEVPKQRRSWFGLKNVGVNDLPEGIDSAGNWLPGNVRGLLSKVSYVVPDDEFSARGNNVRTGKFLPVWFAEWRNIIAVSHDGHNPKGNVMGGRLAKVFNGQEYFIPRASAAFHVDVSPQLAFGALSGFHVLKNSVDGDDASSASDNEVEYPSPLWLVVAFFGGVVGGGIILYLAGHR